MGWKKLLGSISESVNNHFRLRNDYLMAENRILRNQIDGHVQLTDSERQELAEMGAKLGKQTLSEIATIAQADTILAWHRKFANQTVDTSVPPKSVGRPRVDQEIEEWVIRMAGENRLWGYDRIQGSLNHLGYTVSDQTVGNILKRHSIPPAPERKKTITWGEFVRPHLDVLLATDFFNSEAWNAFGLIVSYLLSLIHFGCHVVRSVRMARHQQRQSIQALMRGVLALSLHLRRWAHLIQKRSRAIRASDTALKQTGSEVALVEARSPRSQDRGMVVPLSAARPRPIRDGPIRCQPRYAWPPNGDGCKAA